MRRLVVLFALLLIAPVASADRVADSISETVSQGKSPWELSFKITSEDDGADHDIVWENKTGFTVTNSQEAWALDAGDTLVWRFTITEEQEGTEGTFTFDYTLTVNGTAAETGTLTLTIKEGGGSIADKGKDAINEKTEDFAIPSVGPAVAAVSLLGATALLRRR